MDQQQQLVGKLRGLLREAIARGANNHKGFASIEVALDATEAVPLGHVGRLRRIRDVRRLARHTGTIHGIYTALGPRGWASLDTAQLDALLVVLRALSQAAAPAAARQA